MTDHSETIPDDLTACQEELLAARQRLRDLERQLEETCVSAEELQRSYTCLKEDYLALKRLAFGPRRERLRDDPSQQHLFDSQAEPIPTPEPDDTAPAEAARRRSHRKGHGRRLLPDHLPRRETRHEVPEAKRTCECGRAKVQIGEDVRERLDGQPATFWVQRDIYPKYACPDCKDGVTSAPTVPNPIAGGLAGPGVLASVIIDRFSEHLPYYRQQDIFARNGIVISRSTLCGWVAQCATLFRPLVDLMEQEILQSEINQADETPVGVLDPLRDSVRSGYIWGTSGDRFHPYITFYYTQSRSRDGPAKFFKGYTGYLQTDGYSVYESVVSESAGRIIPVGCWAHARREFFDARFNHPREAHYVLSLIGQMYDVEDEIRKADPAERLAARQEGTVPILNRLEKYLREQQPTALPKSQYGKAIGYALNQWDALRRFTADGRLEIDNNFMERALRALAIGRKNWLFFGSDQGGETAAICFSILASAKRHNVEPHAYVRSLLMSLSTGDADLRSLLPDVWIAAHPEHFMQYRRDEAESAARARQRRRARVRAVATEAIAES